MRYAQNPLTTPGHKPQGDFVMLDLKDIWTCGNGACPKAKSGECWRYVEKPRPGISHRNVSVPYWADACRHFQPIIGLVALSASAMVR